MNNGDPTFSDIQSEFPFFKEYDTQLEFPFILKDDYEKWLRNPTDTHLKNEVIRSITAQNVESVLGIVAWIQLKNKVLIHLLDEFAWPYNTTLLNIEAIKYLDQHVSEDTLQRAIDIEISPFKQKKITLFALLGNIQRNIQESDAITTAPKERTGQV